MKNPADVLREIAHFLGHVAINGADTKDREIALALEQDARALAQQPQQGAVVEAAARAAVLISHYGCVEDRDDLTLPLDDSLDEVAAQEAIAWIRENPTPAAPAPSEPTDTERMDLCEDEACVEAVAIAIERVMCALEWQPTGYGFMQAARAALRAAVDAAMKQGGGA